MKLPLFIILTGMVTILFAGVSLKNKPVENPYKCALGLEDHKPIGNLRDGLIAGGVTLDRIEIDTTPLKTNWEYSVRTEEKGYVIAQHIDSMRTIDIIDSSGSAVAYWEEGKWHISNCEKSIEVVLHCMNQLGYLLKERRAEQINNNHVKPAYFISYFDTLPKQSYIEFNSTGTSVFHNGVEVALRRKNGSWKVIDSRKALEVLYDNIYKRDSVRRSK